jgi:hypothetical protein
MVKLKSSFLIILVAVLLIGQAETRCQDSKPRVIVMTDGEIDDRSSMIRFLMYTNDVDLLAIIETNSVYQREGHSTKDWYDKQLDAYEHVYPNLLIHDPDYPTPDEIKSKSYVGDEDPNHIIVHRHSQHRRPGDEVEISPNDWPDTPGSDKIVEILLEKDPRPVSVSKAIMHNIWYQDGAGNYIEKFHPKVTLLLDHYFNGSWNYGSQSFTHAFISNEVKNNHGPLGALYPQSYVSEGDSPAFLWAIKNGLRNYEDPTYGGWGGRFYRVDGFENVYADVSVGSYTRWIEAANRDFQARMDWCVAEKFEAANHKPIIQFKGDLDRTVRGGQTVVLDATGTKDPDGDYMSFRWWQFQEAGTYGGMVRIDQPLGQTISIVAPVVEQTSTIHIILEVRDRGEPALFSFQRMIITVSP